MHPHPLLGPATDLLFDLLGHQRRRLGGIVRQVEGGLEFHDVAAVFQALDEDGEHGGVLAQGDLGRAHWGEGGMAEEGDPDAVDLGVLIDQHAERAAATEGREELARRAFAAAGDGGRAEALSQARQQALLNGLVERPGHYRHPQAPAVDGGAEQLPVAAMTGEEEERLARRSGLLDLLPAAHLRHRFHEGAVAMEEVEALAECGAVMSVAVAAQPVAVTLRHFREGESEMIQGAAAVAAREEPAEAADPAAHPLRDRPGQAAQGGGEEPQAGVEQGRFQPGPEAALLPARHSSTSPPGGGRWPCPSPPGRGG